MTNKAAGMKKMFTASIALLLLFSGLSCEQEGNDDYRLTVVVTVQDSIRVQNALVRVWVPLENSSIDEYRFTNELGEIELKFDSPVVLDLRAGKAPYKRCSFVELKRGDNIKRMNMIPANNDNTGCNENP